MADCLKFREQREGKNVNLGVEGSNSNGKGKEMDKEGHMMKIIERLQKDTQARRADSQKLMKVRDRQGEFNLRMLKNLERIETKLKKESDSSKTESRRTLRGKEDQGVSADIVVTPQSIPVGKHTVVQSHLLPESTGDLGWMN
jgi:hypothetical protein